MFTALRVGLPGGVCVFRNLVEKDTVKRRERCQTATLTAHFPLYTVASQWIFKHP